jgi:5-(carboxyamino)imidazole ribonucleotide synthase
MSRLGVLGGGQLGRMLALAGHPLGVRCRFLEPAAEAPAAQVAERLRADFNDLANIDAFLAGLDAVTYEFENVPLPLAETLATRLPLHPPPAALAASQDRLAEKTLFRKLGLATAPFVAVEERASLAAAVAQVGTPALLKTRRFGYDGKGQYPLHRPEDSDAAWEALGGVPLVLEGWVPFRRELSLIAARGQDGQTVFYPLVENHHAGGMLRLTLAPAPGLAAGLQQEAERLVHAILEELAYVGVLAVEFFEVNGRLVANEMAPRVHNSGHWTIEGAETSQFENHLRAVLGWPLGSTALLGPCAMLNLIGTLPPTVAVLAVPGAHLHLYGKTPRPGRKLGHITLRGNGAWDEPLRRLQALVG